MRYRSLGALLALFVLAACAPTSAQAPRQKGPTPETLFRWRPFLQNFSRNLLSDAGIRTQIPREQQDIEWLGYEGASEQEIAALEARLGKKLPPSYRAFLLTSNGWRQTGPFIDRLYNASEVDWFRVSHRDWIDAYTFGQLHLLGPSVPDAQYFVYGPEQDPVHARWEYLEDALEISPEGDSAIYLLNPRVIFEDGEWEAWFFANWLPGATRYRSFREMMMAENEGLAELGGSSN